MFHQFLRAGMASVPPTPVYAQPYHFPEGIPPQSPDYAFNDEYGNNMSSEQGSQCGYGSQPESSVFYVSDTLLSSQNFGWSSQGQSCVSPMVQNLTDDQGPVDYPNFSTNTGQFQLLAYPHMLDYPGQDLHLYLDSLSVMSPQSPSMMELYHEKTPVSFQNGPGSSSHCGSVPSPPFPRGPQTLWLDTIAYPPPPLQSHPASQPEPYSPSSTTARIPSVQEGKYRKLSSSSESSTGVLSIMSNPTQIRRRHKKDKSARPFKCRVAGCLKDFDRKHNAKKHAETHQNRPRLEKCPLPGCNFGLRGFNRKHDLDRHIVSRHAEYAKERQHIYKIVVHRCPGCGKTTNRRDILQRHVRTKCPAPNVVKIVDSSSRKLGRARL